MTVNESTATRAGIVGESDDKSIEDGFDHRAGTSDLAADIRLEGVTRRFGDVAAVDDLHLSIGRGEFFSLLGPSGCGKTTTLRMIGGFEQPTEGRVYLGGIDVTDVPPYRRDVNTVFQSYALFPHLDVYDNLAFGLRQRRVRKREIEQRVHEALALVDLAGLGRRKPSQFSGGQQQRVALARALINRPGVLLLDEPLGALDARLRKHMQLELKRIQMEVGITFIYVTHDQEEALTMSDRLAVMHDGKIEQIGAPQIVYDHPTTEFVATFLGASNLLDGTIGDAIGDLVQVPLDNGEVLLVPATNCTRGQRIKIGVRPEKISLFPAGDAPAGWNAVSATVQLTTFVGVSYQYTVVRLGGRVLTVYAQNQGLERLPAPGESVVLAWRPEYSFVVDPSVVPLEEQP